MLIEAWNVLPADSKRERGKAASIENRPLTRSAKAEARRAAAK
jgi:hypothetical protein